VIGESLEFFLVVLGGLDTIDLSLSVRPSTMRQLSTVGNFLSS
jgi:hypothetical protein